MKVIALITASGRGNRFNNSDGIPKQYMPLAGFPMLRHTILAFLNHPQIDEVICTINKDDEKLYEEAVIGLDLLDPVIGGQTRQESVRIGLEALKEYEMQLKEMEDAMEAFRSAKKDIEEKKAAAKEKIQKLK